jgi:hypothetical protein
MKPIKQRKSIFYFLVTATLLIVGSCSKSDDAQPSYPRTVKIEYKVSSSNGLSNANLISYTNATGGSTNVSDAIIPFSLKIDRTVSKSDVVSLTAVHNNAGVGVAHDLKLEILLDGKVVKTETFEGEYISGSIIYFFE